MRARLRNGERDANSKLFAICRLWTGLDRVRVYGELSHIENDKVELKLDELFRVRCVAVVVVAAVVCKHLIVHDNSRRCCSISLLTLLTPLTVISEWNAKRHLGDVAHFDLAIAVTRWTMTIKMFFQFLKRTPRTVVPGKKFSDFFSDSWNGILFAFHSRRPYTP